MPSYEDVNRILYTETPNDHHFFLLSLWNEYLKLIFSDENNYILIQIFSLKLFLYLIDNKSELGQITQVMVLHWTGNK